MIRTEREYQESSRRLKEALEAASRQRQGLVDRGMTPDDVEIVMEPVLSFLSQVRDEVSAYERTLRGELAPAASISDLRRLLISLRIASGLTQRELAHRLGTSESQVSKDERNDYYGVTLERAERTLEVLLDAFDGVFVASVSKKGALRPFSLIHARAFPEVKEESASGTVGALSSRPLEGGYRFSRTVRSPEAEVEGHSAMVEAYNEEREPAAVAV